MGNYPDGYYGEPHVRPLRPRELMERVRAVLFDDQEKSLHEICEMLACLEGTEYERPILEAFEPFFDPDAARLRNPTQFTYLLADALHDVTIKVHELGVLDHADESN